MDDYDAHLIQAFERLETLIGPKATVHLIECLAAYVAKTGRTGRPAGTAQNTRESLIIINTFRNYHLKNNLQFNAKKIAQILHQHKLFSRMTIRSIQNMISYEIRSQKQFVRLMRGRDTPTLPLVSEAGCAEQAAIVGEPDHNKPG